ncbi:MAG: dTMP kinase [Archaeoglobus sp.]|nr:MAG: dTMP kinase [Archaeoglobus sp.]
MKKGLLIAIEGIDGAGKTTLAKALKKWLENIGVKAVIVKEPGNSVWGRKIRESYSKSLSVEEELRLFLKDREVNVREKILPNLRENSVVIMDRYYYSNMAYQGARGIDIEKIRIENLKIAPEPDLVVLLDCDPEICLSRIEKRGSEKNRFEELEYLKKVRDMFLKIAENEKAKVKVVNARRSVDEVFNDVKKLIEPILAN